MRNTADGRGWDRVQKSLVGGSLHLVTRLKFRGRKVGNYSTCCSSIAQNESNLPAGVTDLEISSHRCTKNDQCEGWGWAQTQDRASS